MMAHLGKVTSPTMRLTALVLVMLFVSIVVGSWYAKTEIVARGQGKVVSAGRTQSIQPQFRGQVQEILFTEGSSVKAGDVLVVLNSTEIESSIDKLNIDLTGQKRQLAISNAVLQSLLTLDPATSEFLEFGVTRLAENEISNDANGQPSVQLVRSILDSIRAPVLEIDSEINQIAAALLTQNARIRKADERMRIFTERNAQIQRLLKNGTISRNDYLARFQETRAATSDLSIANKQRDELMSRRTLHRQRRNRIIAEVRAKYNTAVAETELAVRALEADMQGTQHRLLNSKIRSPVSGRVENLKIFTIGGFVDSGQDLMSVVPADEQLEVEAFFENRDVGFLETGQKAIIKLDTFPAERFGFATGTITSVGADARKIVGVAGWVYAVRIAAEKNHVERDGRQYFFAPGMTGTIDVVTGERRLISYFFEPIVKALQDGLGER